MSEKKSLLAQWKLRKKKIVASAAPLLPKDSPVPLSPGQQRLWFLQQLHPQNPFYHYAEIYRFEGPIDIAILLKSMEEIVQRHAILRTTFAIDGSNVIQKIAEEGSLAKERIDLTNIAEAEREIEAHKLAIKAAQQPFDLEKGPLTRLTLIEMTDQQLYLVISMHHLITDKWSMKVLREELAVCYKYILQGQPPKLEPLPLQYADFAYGRQKQPLSETSMSYWMQKLSGDLPVLALPTDRPRPVKPSFKGHYHTQQLSPLLFTQLKQLAKETHTTLFVLLLTAYKILLFRYVAQEDLLVGTPITNRNKSELEQLIGFFNDTVVLRSNLSGNPSFLNLLEEVKRTTLEAFSHKDIPYEALVKALKPARQTGISPIFQTMFLFHQVPAIPSFGEGIKMSHEPFDLGVSKFDLTLYCSETAEDLSATFEYASDLFDKGTIERMQLEFAQLLSSIVANPQQRIQALEILPASIKEELLFNWNDTAVSFPEVPSILSLFDQQVASLPEKEAVVYGKTHLSYKELNDRAISVASTLVELGVKSGDVVGLYTDRSLEMIVGILGILKAGAAYLPLDPNYPIDRIRFMVTDTNVSILLTAGKTGSDLEDDSLRVVDLQNEEVLRTTTSVVLPNVQPNHTAYIIYTSGSTGKPKGVVVSHANLLHSTQARIDYYPRNPESFLLLSSFAFDSSVAGIFWTLCSGGKLVLPKYRIEQDLEALGTILEEQKISHTLLLPSLYALILEHIPLVQLQTLNTIIVAGEACAVSLPSLHASKLGATAFLYNEYGPTEASVWCTVHKIEPLVDQNVVPIGRPIANTQIYILDKNLAPVPVGVAGEIYIGGNGITAGYWERPVLTEERFISNPFLGSAESTRLYRTGDLAKYQENGLIEFLGRVDQQVKVRGFRIELEEIRTALLEEISIQDAVVLIDQESFTDRAQVVAYLKGTNDLVVKTIKGQLKSRLPEYMVPSAFIPVVDFPRLPNGKVDQKQLILDHPNEQLSSDNYVAPTSPIEKELARIWGEVLRIEEVSIQDNFFEIGGDSILSIQIISKARRAGIPLAANQLFEHQTIEELALFTMNTLGATREIRSSNSSEGIPISPIQHWFFETHNNAPHYWNQGILFQPAEFIDATIAAQAIQQLVLRHDVLRVGFHTKAEQKVASLRQPEEIIAFQMVESEVTHLNDFLSEQCAGNFDLSSPPLFVCIYFQEQGKAIPSLLFVAHHLVIDSVSWEILLDEFSNLVELLGQGKTNVKVNDLPSIECSYADWCNILKSASEKGEFNEELPYWQEQMQTDNNFYVDYPKELPILEKDIKTKEVFLAKEETDLLQKDALQAYHTNVEDLLLTALTQTLTLWNKNSALSLSLERHGREVVDGFSPSQALGWFTSYFPLQLELVPEHTIEGAIKSIKEQVRSIPNNGIGYGVLRYLEANKTLQAKPSEAPPVVFNYLGDWDKRRIHGKGTTTFLTRALRDPKSERYYLLEVNAFVQEGKLKVIWSYSSAIYKDATIEKIATEFIAQLKQIIAHCIEKEKTDYTPSDFPESGLNQKDLDNLLDLLT